ncbi:MAG: C45 family autoproteolytic acyltransferase/hydrolase [Planctomycetota bacterium]|jgi:hypothetical protein
MPYTESVRKYRIDLGKRPAERWAEVIEKEKDSALRLAQESLNDIEEYMGTNAFYNLGKSPLLQNSFGLAYKMAGGLHVGEMRAWARALKMQFGATAFLNCTYEVNHWLDRIAQPFGCTAGVVRIPKVGLVHVRSMDWDLPYLGNATRVFNFVKGDHECKTIGVPGLVGAISGMVPGAYSVTLNWAPPTEKPKWELGPLFLLREVLTTCETYEEAVNVLSETPIAASCFYMVCGVTEACVIERTQYEYAIRKMGRGPLVQTNHHILFDKLNEPLYEEDEEGAAVIYDSEDRADTLLAQLRKAKSVGAAASALDKEPVFNENSYQQMVFIPKTGEMRAWRWSN